MPNFLSKSFLKHSGTVPQNSLPSQNPRLFKNLAEKADEVYPWGTQGVMVPHNTALNGTKIHKQSVYLGKV